ncbi:MAG: response regulator [Myxococcota bacterium]|nr:response regulator [Myxococcota bacterium]
MHIDLVILDLTMSKLSGKEPFFAMRQVNPALRAILCSGHAVDGTVQGLTEAGVLGFVQKPYRRATLACTVADARRKASPATGGGGGGG